MRSLICMLLMVVASTMYAVDLDKENRDPKYVDAIVKRSQKIVDKLELKDAKVAETVLNILANRYFSLNDIYEVRDAKIKAAKESGASKEAKENAIKAAQDEAGAALYRCHFAFPADLGMYINDKQIEAVKDGMTYGVLPLTYASTLDMIPSLTDEEKARIYTWLVEAREFSIDAENSDKKHAAFGKYKGKINNYLDKRGYNLKKEREEWNKRVKARGGKL